MTTVQYQREKPATPPEGTVVEVDGGYQVVKLDYGLPGASTRVNVNNPLPITTLPKYDVYLTWTGSNITQVVYKEGADVIATLTLTYSGSKLSSVVRS
jgi:hypothetical protein